MDGDPAQLAPFAAEAGGHRWQRVPPSEKRGRTHTSTVTVAVLPVVPEREWRLRESEIKVFTTLGTGPGGQHRNKTESCVVVRHLPTGIEARADSKSQYRNRVDARMVLEARVAEFHRRRDSAERDAARRAQAGSGMRGDKIRTYREIDDRVLDDRTGRKASLKRVRERGLQVLWA